MGFGVSQRYKKPQLTPPFIPLLGFGIKKEP